MNCLLKKSGKVVCMLLALAMILGSMTPLLAARVHDAEAERTVRDPGGEREEHMYMEAMQLPIPAPEHVLREHGITLAPEGIFATDDNEYIEAGGRDTSVEMVPAPASVLLEAGIASALEDRSLTLEDMDVFEEFFSEARIIFAPEGQLPVADIWQMETRSPEEIGLREEVPTTSSAPDHYDSSMQEVEKEAEHEQRASDINVNAAMVTITYRGNGYTSGEVPTGHTYAAPTWVTLRQPGTMVKDGFQFAGWRNQFGNTYPGGHVWFAGGTLNLVYDAVWTPLPTTVTITYRSNGHHIGTVPPMHNHSTPTTVTLAQPGNLHRHDHAFIGWRDAAGYVRPAGYTWTQNTGGTITFDAVWVHITSLYLRGNGNTHGTVPPVQTVAVPGVLTLPPPGTMVRSGHMFVGWRCWTGAFHPVGVSWTSGGGGFLFYAEWVPITELHLVGNGHQQGIVPPIQRVAAPGTLTMPQPGTMTRPGYRFNGWRCWSGNSLLPPGFSWRSYGGGFLFFAEWVPDTSLPVEIAGFDIIAHLPTETTENRQFLIWQLTDDLLDMVKDSTYLVLVFDAPLGVTAYLSWMSPAVFRQLFSTLIPLYGTVFKINLAQTLNQYARFVTTPCSVVFLELGGWDISNIPMPRYTYLSNGVTN